MVRWMWILSILALASGCSNPISPIIGSDYFPLKDGEEWVYQRGTDEMIFSVTSNSNGGFILLDEGEGKNLKKEGGILKEKCEEFFVVNGEKIVSDSIWENVLKFPLVVNQAWADTYKIDKIYNGDTLRKKVIRSCSVIEQDAILLPYGRVNNAIHLIRKRYEFFRGSVDSIAHNEWYGPDIGLVKREEDIPLLLKMYKR